MPNDNANAAANDNAKQTAQPPAPPAAEETAPHYLREAIRLAELLIEHQTRTFNGIDRQAIWLVTLCTATMGYLLYAKPDNLDFWPVGAENILDLWALAAFLMLANAARKSAEAVLSLREFNSPGAAPEYATHGFFGGSFNAMAADLLAYYQSAAGENEKILKEKTTELKKSLWWAKIGFANAFAVVLFNFVF